MGAPLFPIASYLPILLLVALPARTITVERGFLNTKVAATVRMAAPTDPASSLPLLPLWASRGYAGRPLAGATLGAICQLFWRLWAR